jgi:hypothetical protein
MFSATNFLKTGVSNHLLPSGLLGSVLLMVEEWQTLCNFNCITIGTNSKEFGKAVKFSVNLTA